MPRGSVCRELCRDVSPGDGLDAATDDVINPRRDLRRPCFVDLGRVGQIVETRQQGAGGLGALVDRERQRHLRDLVDSGCHDSSSRAVHDGAE